MMRRFLCAAAALWLMLLLSGCASLGLGGPRQVEVPLTRLQGELDKRFPQEQRVLEIYTIRLSQPRLSLTAQPGQERLHIALTTDAALPLTGKTWTGRLEMSGRLAIDPGRQAIILREPRVDRYLADGLDDTRQRLLTLAADLAIQYALRDPVLHTFKADELRYLGTQYTPIAIRPTQDALRITFDAEK
jgi:hypothetical protein